MLKIAILLAPLLFLCSSVLGQEYLQILTLHRDETPSVAPIQSIGVSVKEEKLNEVSNSILMAENWLRTHVLSHYPFTNINSIVISKDNLCNEKIINQEENLRLTLDSMKNIYYSLTRWGLEREIKVSVSLFANCLHKSHLKNIFTFLEEINSTYTINTPQFSNEIITMLTAELSWMNHLGIFRSEIANVITPMSKQAKFTSRKLQFLDPLWFPPTPPSQPVEFLLAPAPVLAPEIRTPMMSPANSPSPHHGINLPPCNPYPHFYNANPPVVVNNGGGPTASPQVVPVVSNGSGPTAAPPVVSGSGGYGEQGVWCVAKPSVPSEKLQVAMDYACGAGGADCGPIRPNGSCYSPDSVVAHASYAFNSYWQKNKKNGGVCGFEGTAMLISSDPSFLHCHFILG